MFSEMDTDAFLAYAKAHQRDLVQQAEIDALRRRAVRRQQGKAHQSQLRQALLRSLRYCGRTARLRGHTLWQMWVFVAKTWAREYPSQTPRTSRG